MSDLYSGPDTQTSIHPKCKLPQVPLVQSMAYNTIQPTIIRQSSALGCRADANSKYRLLAWEGRLEGIEGINSIMWFAVVYQTVPL